MTEFSPFCACVYACVFIYAIVFSHSSVDRFLVLMGIQENVNLEWTSRLLGVLVRVLVQTLTPRRDNSLLMWTVLSHALET